VAATNRIGRPPSARSPRPVLLAVAAAGALGTPWVADRADPATLLRGADT
jgi:hypothetical protein